MADPVMHNKALEPTLAVKAICDRIDAVVSREQRCAILVALGCFEQASFRRAKVVSARGRVACGARRSRPRLSARRRRRR